MTYYLQGNINYIKTHEEAEIWQTSTSPSVIRLCDDGTYSFYHLSTTLVQFGQAEFQIKEGDTLWLIDAK